ncbi:MAG: GTPase [Nanoarchaeota archaeon]|nr:50S ribosome-binding GTPase [Nanoarchaeota archaeon]
MASTNQSPAYQKAQGKFLSASTDDERLEALEEMIKECPKHKSSENMLANLKTRYKKLKEKIQRIKKSGKSSRTGIKKEDLQAVIVGVTNTGKSSLLSALTNANPKIAETKFTTTAPITGMAPYSGTYIQLIENPAIESEYYDKGLTNTTDTILILVDDLEQIKKVEKKIDKASGKRIIVFNNKNDFDESGIRKIEATLKSRKYDFIILSNKESLEKLKNKIFQNSGKIRIFTKEPNCEKSPRPIIMKPNSTVGDVAEKILKGFSKKVKTSKIWGPSSKFAGQQVGLKHKLKDLDVVEFKTR